MKSITVAIRNGENRVIGLFVLTSTRCAFLSSAAIFHANEEAKEAASSVNFASDVEELRPNG